MPATKSEKALPSETSIPLPPLLTRAQVAALLQCGERTVDRLIKSKRIARAYSFGRSVRIPKQEVERLLVPQDNTQVDLDDHIRRTIE